MHDALIRAQLNRDVSGLADAEKERARALSLIHSTWWTLRPNRFRDAIRGGKDLQRLEEIYASVMEDLDGDAARAV